MASQGLGAWLTMLKGAVVRMDLQDQVKSDERTQTANQTASQVCTAMGRHDEIQRARGLADDCGWHHGAYLVHNMLHSAKQLSIA